MITIDSIEFHAYTTLINGNSGEEQLVLMLSPMQSGRCACSIMAVQCDGGLRLVVHGTFLTNEMSLILPRYIEEWLNNPAAATDALVMTKKISEHYHF